MELLGNTLALYDDGDLEGTLPQLGAVAGRIEEILPAAEIIRRTVEEFGAVLGGLGRPLRRRGDPDLTAGDQRRRATPVDVADTVVSRRGRRHSTWFRPARRRLPPCRRTSC